MTEFKIGDWIKHKVYIEAPMQINEVYKTAVHIKYNGIYDNTEVELWQPTVGEWVWSKGSYTQAFIFKWTSAHVQAGIINYTNYEPFIGQLPTFIKDQS